MHSGDFSAKIVAMRQKLNRLATTVLQHQQIRWITMMMAMMMMMMMAMGGDHNLLLFLSAWADSSAHMASSLWDLVLVLHVQSTVYL